MEMIWGITVEPVLLLYMLSLFMAFTTLHDLIYVKVCMNKFSVEICDNLFDYKNRNALDKVQTDAAHWIFASSLTLAIPSIISSQFIGCWSDTFGRKVPMLLPPIGGILASLLYIGLSINLKEWPVSLALLAAAVTGICGGTHACNLACMSYISQVSSIKNRTVRVGILESMMPISGSVGPILADWIQRTYGRAAVFSVITFCQAVNVIYITIFIRNILPSEPLSLPWWKVLCNCSVLRDSFLTVIRPRPENKRTYLLLLIAAASIFVISTSVEFCCAPSSPIFFRKEHIPLSPVREIETQIAVPSLKQQISLLFPLTK